LDSDDFGETGGFLFLFIRATLNEVAVLAVLEVLVGVTLGIKDYLVLGFCAIALN